DIEREFHFNTAIAAIMELFNALQAYEQASGEGGAGPHPERTALLREATETLLLLLGPFCPHVTEELWARLGHSESLFRQRWPEANPAALQKTEVTVVVQVDGKVRGRLVVDVDTADDRIRQLALGDDRVGPWIGRTAGSGGWPWATTGSGRGSDSGASRRSSSCPTASSTS